MPHTSSCRLLLGHVRCHVFQAMFLSHDPGIFSQWAKYQEVVTQMTKAPYFLLRFLFNRKNLIINGSSHNFIVICS